MSTRRPHLHSAGATRMRAAVVLPLLLLLLLACAAACPLCVRAVDTNSYEEAERTNTLAFLQSFVTPGSTLADVWTGTDFCTWTYITCQDDSVTLDLQALRPTAPLALPELANSVDGGGVLLTRIRADGLGSSLSGTLPASWSRLTQLTTVFLAGNALTGPLPGAWSSLTGLELFNAGKNAFTGTLPAEWGSLRRLSFLDVSVNQLTGPIPESWSSMSRLYSLYLQSNQLTGAIPAGLGVWNLNSVNITNNQFCGCVSSLWNSSSRITLSADPPMRAVDCMSANACAVDESSSVAERATLAFLQGFAVSMPSLQSTWADTRYCAWPGVACTMDKDVSLDFADVALTAVGSLPALSDSVDGSLIPLTRVRISGKAAMVSGSLPASWSRLTQLREVTLAGNALTGPLPVSWSSLAALTSLNLGNNELTGPLPAQWSSLAALTSLDLDANQLSGSLPATWSDMSRLQSLNLGKNQFTGTLPKSWGLMAQLKHLALNSNQLTGRIPTAVGALLLTTVDISSNQFCGCVSSLWNSSSDITLTADPPMRAWNCLRVSACPVDESSSAAERATLAFLQTFAVSMPSLRSVWADTRYCAWPGVVCNTDDTVALDFADVALTAVGSLPALSDSVDGSLIPLTQVQISGKAAMVSGQLPASWSSLTQLREVTLAGNALTGSLPAEWSAFRWLRALNMSRNALNGTLPADWSSMQQLTSLDLSVNKVHGTLPEEWSNMIALRQLHLNSNQLMGTIPSRMGLLSLSTVDISRNQFTGCAPRQWRESCSLTLRADPPMTTGVCAIDKSCDEKSGSAASSTSGECEVIGCERCEVGAARVCARCEPGYILTPAKSCAKEGSGVAADARAGAVVAAVTGAVLAFSLVMTL
ncbi:Leucine rich repeat N-terminal domain containing protein [Novymonas esmeraldas]|uniref:Leucine rich repeat N-terminal domain containing protein n=1 Tax=Novymonas esmeraldas TaxID=1808958 RepID=A0AAW0F2A7_9TRYP